MRRACQMRRALDLYLYVLVRGFPSEGDKGEAAHGVALPPRAAGGFYLGLAIPATAGDGDGTRADADAADGRDRRRSRSAPVVGRPLGDVPVLTVVVVPPGWLPGGVLPGGVSPQLAVQPRRGAVGRRWRRSCSRAVAGVALRTVARLALRALATGLVAVAADAEAAEIIAPNPALRSRARRPAIFSADAPASKAPTARAAKESLLIPDVLAADSAVPGMGMPPPDTPFRAGMLARPASEGRSARPGRAPSPASWDAAGTFVSPAPPAPGVVPRCGQRRVRHRRAAAPASPRGAAARSRPAPT